MNDVDAALKRHLRSLPRAVSEPMSNHALYQRMSALANEMAIAEAFRERLGADDLGIGTAHDGQLTHAGQQLRRLTIENYVRSETRSETHIRGQASLRRACLYWTFASEGCADEGGKEGCAAFMVSASRRAAPTAPPVTLISVRIRQGHERIRISEVGLRLLDDIVCTRLSPVPHLCLLLVGLFPEMHAPEWELLERVHKHLAARSLRRCVAGARWWRRHWWRCTTGEARYVHAQTQRYATRTPRANQNLQNGSSNARPEREAPPDAPRK